MSDAHRKVCSNMKYYTRLKYSFFILKFYDHFFQFVYSDMIRTLDLETPISWTNCLTGLFQDHGKGL